MENDIVMLARQCANLIAGLKLLEAPDDAARGEALSASGFEAGLGDVFAGAEGERLNR